MMKLGTRRSPLAMWQARHVQERLEGIGVDVELVPITTRGDRIQNRALTKIGGKGLFLKEIEDAILQGRADMAVHSLKDVPAEMPEGLTLAGFMGREDPRDALAGDAGVTLQSLPAGAVVGTGSLRRAVQVLRLRPDISIRPIRGNVETRLRKRTEEGLAAVILAAAGLKRLGMEERISSILDPDEVIPAAGQGILGLQCRIGDEEALRAIRSVSDPPATACALAERAFLETLGGSCQVPMGGYCRADEDGYRMSVFIASPDGSYYAREEDSGPDPSDLGNVLAERLLARGAAEVMARVDDYPHPF